MAVIERSGVTRLVDELAPELLTELLNEHQRALSEYEARGRDAYEHTPPEVRTLALSRVIEQATSGDQASRWWARAWLDCWDRDRRAREKDRRGG